MGNPLTKDAELTAEAVARMVIEAAVFGKFGPKREAALNKLIARARRAEDDAITYANVYPLRGGGGSREAVDAAREARRRVADLLGRAAASERFEDYRRRTGG